jgi:beta-lactamase class A
MSRLHPHPCTPARKGKGRRLIDRRSLILSAAALPVAAPALAAPSPFAAIEARAKGVLGVFALDVSTGRRLAYRADQRFPMCSTFKLLLAAFVLARVDAGHERLDRRIAYGAADLLEYAPTTRAHVAEGGMVVRDLCIAAIQLSDNTAANLLLREVGGPQALTAWLRKIGDPATRLDNNEPSLNVWAPGERHDTTTPRAIVAAWRRLLLGDVLSASSKAHLIAWLQGATTGLARLRAGFPSDWRAGDKTGSWSDAKSGTTNDIAIVWPPEGGPILAAAFLTQSTVPLAEREAALAGVGRVIAERFAHG